MTFRELVENDKGNYMLLNRLQQDCETFINSPRPSEKRLWAGNIKDQIKEMNKIWKALKEKPEWLTQKEIKNYEKTMIRKQNDI